MKAYFPWLLAGLALFYAYVSSGENSRSSRERDDAIVAKLDDLTRLEAKFASFESRQRTEKHVQPAAPMVHEESKKEADAKWVRIAETYKEDNARLRKAVESVGRERERLAEQLKEARTELAAVKATRIAPKAVPVRASPSPAPVALRNAFVAGAAQRTSAAPKVKAVLNYWMTSSSRKRHNQGCRYYMNSRGGQCGPNDGIACKICGG